MRAVLILACAAGAVAAASQMPDEESPERWALGAREVYTEYCAGCHGQWAEGGSAGSLVDDEWVYGGSNEEIAASIREGRPDTAMIAFGEVLEEEQIQKLVGLLRMAAAFADFRNPRPILDPDGVEIASEKQAFRFEVVARPLWVPWGLEFRPDGTLLISDREGQIRIVEDGRLRPDPVAGTPATWTVQDGGYLDIALHPEFEKTGWVYLAFSDPGRGNTSAEPSPANTSMTKIVRARIRDNRWEDAEVVYEAPAELYSPRSMHYGSRLLFDGDGKLLFSIGDRGEKAEAQDLSSPLGKVHRVNDDGSVPPDNPFVGQEGALATIWTFGHRNPQGLAIDPSTGDLWASEHGPIGGDELNVLEPGRNYGWPAVSNGLEPGISETTREGLEPPITHWTPSIAPSGIVFNGGDRYPGWKGALFVAGLGGRALRRLEVSGRRVTHEEVVFEGYGRVRDIVAGPDGLLYAALENRVGIELTEPLGLVVRLVPVE